MREALKQPVQINLGCKHYSFHSPLAEAIGTGNAEIVGLILAHPEIKVSQPDKGRLDTSSCCSTS